MIFQTFSRFKTNRSKRHYSYESTVCSLALPFLLIVVRSPSRESEQGRPSELAASAVGGHAGIGEVAVEHQGADAHAWGCSSRPKAACVGPTTSKVAAVDDSTAAAAFPAAREAGDRWYGFRRTRGGGGGAGLGAWSGRMTAARELCSDRRPWQRQRRKLHGCSALQGRGEVGMVAVALSRREGG